jgi:hypothetical protein
MAQAPVRTVLYTVLLASAVACSAPHPTAESAARADMASITEAAGADVPALPPAPSGSGVQHPGVDAGQLVSSANTATDPQRRFVRTATAGFQVDDVYAATLKIEDAAVAAGGFVVSNRIGTQTLREIERAVDDGKLLRLSEVQTHGSLVVRVPGERTQAFLREIAQVMAFLDARSFEADDVQFDLLRKQLAYQRAQEAQADIATAGAQPGKTGARVDAAIARAEARAARDEAIVEQRELEDRIAFSTLTLELRQPMQVREQRVPDTRAILRARGPGFFSELGEALRAGWRSLLAAVLGLARLWPFWLVLVTALVLVRAWHKRRATAPAGPASTTGHAPSRDPGGSD